MSTLGSKYALRDGEFVCKRGRGWVRVFLDRCYGCEHRHGCKEYKTEFAKLLDDESEDLQKKEPPAEE